MSYIFGFILGIELIKHLNKKNESNLKNESINNFFFLAVIGVILGGRLGYVVLYNPLFYFDNPLEIIKVWKGGMSFHGGLIGIILSIFIFSKKEKVNFYFLSDLVACAAPIGIFLGRIANFINGELVGRATEKQFGVIFKNFDNVPRHPSQIYEAVLEGFLLFVILLILQNNKNIIQKHGVLSSYFLILYSLFRFFCEFFREPDLHIGFQYLNLTLGQIYSIFFIILGIIVFLKKRN